MKNWQRSLTFLVNCRPQATGPLNIPVYSMRQWRQFWLAWRPATLRQEDSWEYFANFWNIPHNFNHFYFCKLLSSPCYCLCIINAYFHITAVIICTPHFMLTEEAFPMFLCGLHWENFNTSTRLSLNHSYRTTRNLHHFVCRFCLNIYIGGTFD